MIAGTAVHSLATRIMHRIRNLDSRVTAAETELARLSGEVETLKQQCHRQERQP